MVSLNLITIYGHYYVSFPNHKFIVNVSHDVWSTMNCMVYLTTQDQPKKNNRKAQALL